MDKTGLFFIDESIHQDAGFIVAACCYLDFDPNQDIYKILKQNGFNPEIEEYKSSHVYEGNGALISLRNNISEIVTQTKIGLVILPDSHRQYLGTECVKAVKEFVIQNKIDDRDINVFLDEGMFLSDIPTGKITGMNINIFAERNSILTRGLQLSDYVAHIASLQLKWRMGLLSKMINGPNDIPTELGFEMWARLRYYFFQFPDPTHEAIHSVEPYGLYISQYCSPMLANEARKSFSEVYVGCIH